MKQQIAALYSTELGLQSEVDKLRVEKTQKLAEYTRLSKDNANKLHEETSIRRAITEKLDALQTVETEYSKLAKELLGYNTNLSAYEAKIDEILVLLG